MPKKREAIITGKLPSGGGGGGEGKTYTGLPTATAETIVDNNANTISVNVTDIPESVYDELVTDLQDDLVTDVSVSNVLPGALKLALNAQTKSNSGLEVDEEGNISVSVKSDELEIVDNKIQIAFDAIDVNG